MAEPLTREEKYLNAIANSQNINLKPITREEIFLAKASGQDITTPTPITRREMFLSKISSGSKPEQEKKVEITKNGATEIFPDEGYVLSKVTANVNVVGESKLTQLIEGTLTEITAEDLEGITKIRAFAFYAMGNLEAVELPNTITTVGSNAFAGISGSTRNKIKTLVFPDSITTIADGVCADCPNLQNVVLPQNAQFTRINSNSFRNCSQLNDVVIPNSITRIDGSAFYYCSKLSNITLSNSLTYISSSAFSYCSALTTLTIPASVTEISGSNTLNIGTDTNKATFIFLPTKPPYISTDVFSVIKINKIIVPAGSGEAYKTATNWANFADYIEEAAE